MDHMVADPKGKTLERAESRYLFHNLSNHVLSKNMATRPQDIFSIIILTEALFFKFSTHFF